MDETSEPRGLTAISAAQGTHAIGDLRGVAMALLDLINGAVGARVQQYTALNLGVTIGDQELADAGITRAQFQSAISSLIAFQTLLGQGHSTNLWAILS